MSDSVSEFYMGRAEKLQARNNDLEISLSKLVERCKIDIEEIGGCDHSVGICICDYIGEVEEAEKLLNN